MILEKKICKKCNGEKPLSEFHFRKDSQKYRNECKVCFAAAVMENHSKVKSTPRYLETKRKYYQDNKEVLSQKNKEWRENNVAHSQQYRQKYYKENKKELDVKKKLHYESKKEYYLSQKKEWYEANKEYHRTRQNEYDKVNKERLRAARREWERDRLSKDLDYRLQKNLRRRLQWALKDGKAGKGTIELIGCSVPDFRKHIESLFHDGMNWSNYGKWHIDHKIPISWFNLQNESCRNLACNYKNLQPLWGRDNILKNNKRADVLSH